MRWLDDIRHFDLGRLTFVGWLVFLLSVAVCIGLIMLMVTYQDSLFPGLGEKRGYKRMGAIAAFSAAIGFFFVAKALLRLANLEIVRPKPDENPAINE